MNLSSALREWQNLLGDSRVIGSETSHRIYGADASGETRDIALALKIDDSGCLSDVMQIANRHGVPVYPISTGKNWGYGSSLPVRDQCVLLDLSSLRKILHFDAELGVVTVEPGVTQGDLSGFLTAGNHPFMVPVTGAGPDCSLVGNALERGYGITPYTDHFGAVTDIEAVLADGSRYRTALSEAGGADLARLFKWGIGPYSAGLFSQGNFGIVTRMSILLARRPECVKVCLFSLRDDALLEIAVERIRAVLSKLPGTVGAVNLMNRHRVLAMSAPYPADKIGADGLIPPEVIAELGRQYQILPWTGFATMYGTHRIVAAAKEEMKSALKNVACRVVFLSPQSAALLGRAARYVPGQTGYRLSRTAATLASSLELVAGQPNETALPLAYWRSPEGCQGMPRNPSTDGCGLIWYAPLVPMRPAGVRAYAQMVHSVTRRYGIEPLMTFTSINDRLFDSTVPLLFNRGSPQELDAAKSCYSDLLRTGREMGFFPYRVGIAAMPLLSSFQQDSKRVHDHLRQSLDPFGVVAPGRYQ